MGDLLYFQKWQIKGPHLEGVSVTLTAQFLGVSNNIRLYDYDKEWQSNQYLAYLLPNVSSSKATFKIVSCMQQTDQKQSVSQCRITQIWTGVALPPRGELWCCCFYFTIQLKRVKPHHLLTLK